jgi:cyclic pyranopterin phosphate synthase
MEWRDSFNSFNSWKGLLYADWYESIAYKKFLPPIEASLDPIHSCNLMCEHCNAHRYLGGARMKKQHLLNLVSFLGEWGVKAICYGGGGEPTLHPNLGEAITKTPLSGMDASVATNGSVLTDSLIDTLANYCRWVGVSVDAATPKTYEMGRKQDMFRRVIKNISFLCDKVRFLNTKCDVAYKFLIFDYNQHEIFQAAKIARDLGVRDFHARPADFRHQGMGEFKKKNNFYNVNVIKEQLEMCHRLETKDFHVFTVTHKFNEDFTPKRRFTQCYAAPICIQLCADGGIYFCPDTRHMEAYKIGSHDNIDNILEVWGGEKHKQLVFNSGCSNCQSRCTFSPYNEMCERLYIKQDDPFCKNFV